MSGVKLPPSSVGLPSEAHRTPRNANGPDTATCYPCSAMRCPERIGRGPCFKGGTVLPYRLGGVERVILGLRAFEKVKLQKPRNLVEMTVAREPDLLEAGLPRFVSPHG